MIGIPVQCLGFRAGCSGILVSFKHMSSSPPSSEAKLSKGEMITGPTPDEAFPQNEDYNRGPHFGRLQGSVFSKGLHHLRGEICFWFVVTGSVGV